VAIEKLMQAVSCIVRRSAVVFHPVTKQYRSGFEMRVIESVVRAGIDNELDWWPVVAPAGVATRALQVTKEVAPGVSLALLRDPTNPSDLLLDDRIVAAARALGLKPQLVDVRGAVDFQDAFAAILEQLAQALFVYPLPLAPVQIGQIVEFALNNKLPGSTFWEGYVEQGFLMFYGTRLSEQNRRAVAYVDKVLKGAQPASLPVEQPTKFDLVINLKTAKMLGLTIQPTILAQADEVIE
jgi:putative ABC transport system substrate-binding protein